jgi:hypothetical protein
MESWNAPLIRGAFLSFSNAAIAAMVQIKEAAVFLTIPCC